MKSKPLHTSASGRVKCICLKWPPLNSWRSWQQWASDCQRDHQKYWSVYIYFGHSVCIYLLFITKTPWPWNLNLWAKIRSYITPYQLTFTTRYNWLRKTVLVTTRCLTRDFIVKQTGSNTCLLDRPCTLLCSCVLSRWDLITTVRTRKSLRKFFLYLRSYHKLNRLFWQSEPGRKADVWRSRLACNLISMGKNFIIGNKFFTNNRGTNS